MKKIITLMLCVALSALMLTSCGDETTSGSNSSVTTMPATPDDVLIAQYTLCSDFLNLIAANTDVTTNGANANAIGDAAMELTRNSTDPATMYIYTLGNIVYLSFEYYNGGANGSTTYDDKVDEYKALFPQMTAEQQTAMPLIADKVFADSKANMIKNFEESLVV